MPDRPEAAPPPADPTPSLDEAAPPSPDPRRDEERTEVADALDDIAAGYGAAAEEIREPGEDAGYGRPGRPLARSPLLFGFLAGLGLIGAYVAYVGIQRVFGIVLVVFVAMFLAVGLNPTVVRLRRWGLPRGVAVAVVAFGTFLVVCGGVFALVPPIVSQGGQFIEHLPQYIGDLKHNRVLNDLDDRFHVIEGLKSAATPQNMSLVFGGVLGGALLLFGTVFNVLTGLVLTIYFLAAFDRLAEGAYKLVPASRRQRVRLLGDAILTKVGGYMVGALSIAACAGGFSFVFMLIAGIPYAYALALVVAVTDLIPQVGATLGAIVVSLVGFAVSIPVGIACVVFFLLYQQLENWVIYPTVMRRSVKVSDLAAIVGVLFGAALLGVVGTLIAIPVVAAVQIIIREVVIPRQNAT